MLISFITIFITSISAIHLPTTLCNTSDGVVVKVLAFGTSGTGFDSRSVATISDIGYLLLPSWDMAEIQCTAKAT